MTYGYLICDLNNKRVIGDGVFFVMFFLCVTGYDNYCKLAIKVIIGELISGWLFVTTSIIITGGKFLGNVMHSITQ